MRKCFSSNYKKEYLTNVDKYDISVCLDTQILEFSNIKRDKSENIFVPQKTLVAFNESVRCYENKCFVASFVMIKRALEEIFKDKSIKGYTLKSKIENISLEISLPRELIEAINEIKILNDVFFDIESKNFTDTTEIEIWLIIDLTKEIIKNLY
ncbi:MAG: DUF4145 domain-containing protein [Alphaproteobacteria bacterium]